MENSEKIWPLISCLCITDRRVLYLKRAIKCFLAQSYPNKELIVICKKDDLESSSFVKDLNERSIRLCEVSNKRKLTLGELRNISIKQAQGEYFCQWDDDDWSHKDRLNIQLHTLLDNHFPVSMLTNIFIFDVVSKQAYFSHFRLWDQTVLGIRELFPKVKYKRLNKSEDFEFTKTLMVKSKIYPTISFNQYIYVFHGGNTCSKDHFQWLFGYCQKMPRKISHLIEEILNGSYTVEDASNLLNSPTISEQINYFFYSKKEILNGAK